MGWKSLIAIIALLIIILLMSFYFMPFSHLNFSATGNSNFSLSGNSEMQYYPNLRFAETNIPYRISDCPLSKKNEMESAFNIMENLTPLKFYSVEANEKILVTCQDKNQVENGLFIAGEGGPTSIIVTGQFYVVDFGEVLLIKESDCPHPNIAIHELLHVLGFKHSDNPENIMYNITNCDQTIGDDTIKLINYLYSIPSYPDLVFENASAIMNGRFLNLDTTIENSGLEDAGASKMGIYVDDNLVKEIDFGSIGVGQGLTLNLKNVLVSQLDIHKLTLVIETDFSEISKENNKIELEIKK
jgi:hypothetical protein